MSEREKDPKRVAAGLRLHAWLREKLGAAGYSARQRAAAYRSNAAQLAALGPDGYREQRQAAYHAMLERYGPERAKAILATAHDAGRRKRLANPRPGEAAITAAWQALGGVVHEPADGFNYFAWQVDPYGIAYGGDEAIREAQIGPYFVDFLLPAHQVVIEVNGGVHAMLAERDAARSAWLEEARLRVYVIDEAEAIQPDRAEAFIERILG